MKEKKKREIEEKKNREKKKERRKKQLAMGYWGFYSPITMFFSLAMIFVTFAIHLYSFMQGYKQGQVTKSSWTGGRADMRVLILSTQASWTDGPSAGRTDG